MVRTAYSPVPHMLASSLVVMAVAGMPFDGLTLFNPLNGSAASTTMLVNNDGEVGVDEVLVLIAAWGTDDSQADVNGDGTIDTNDVLLVLSAWGPCP